MTHALVASAHGRRALDHDRRRSHVAVMGEHPAVGERMEGGGEAGPARRRSSTAVPS
ncbi:hypothetical protein [Nocardiopsis alba]|uniref:hypothetical protein n=1 Tax=Nocardiopsis alba TaxID=53437 RepID=UPI0035D72FFD